MVAPIVDDWLEAIEGTTLNPIHPNNGGVIARAAWTWQWYREATPIGGATEFRYQVQAADIGDRIRVETIPIDIYFRETDLIVSEWTDPVTA